MSAVVTVYIVGSAFLLTFAFFLCRYRVWRRPTEWLVRVSWAVQSAILATGLGYFGYLFLLLGCAMMGVRF